jgi:putative ABC transport system substrate-binding protein
MSIELNVVAVRTPDDLDAAFSSIRRVHPQALYLVETAVLYTRRVTIAKLALHAKLPTIYGTRAFTEAGGLMSYGMDYADQIRRAAGYVDKILKGANPGDLPIEQPTKFELVVNLKTAKALGITIPQSILLRADEVIR